MSTTPSKLAVEIAEAIEADIGKFGRMKPQRIQDFAALIDAKLAPLAPRPVLHWKPIESAPKDDAILVCEGHEKSLPVIAVWVDTRRGGQWHMFGTELETKPEYWMPIPNPPAQRPAQEGGDKT